jgi:tetratricopeptide (TPR) repeat protein
MCGAGGERVESTMHFRLALGALVTMVAAISMFAQSYAPTRLSGRLASRGSPVLPKACLDQEHPSEKIAALLESIRDHPTAGAYNTLGVLYAQGDRLNCAVPAFQAALKLEGQNWEAHYNLALALIKTGDRCGAKKELQAAIQQKPDSVSSHFALGSLFQSENKLDEAAEAFKAALNIDPHFVPASLKLSQVLISGSKTAAAIACLEDALKLLPPADQNAALQASLALAYVDNGDANRGLETLKNLVLGQPNSADAHFSLGLLYAKNSQPADQEAAAAQYREALRLDPGIDPARLALGRVLLSSRNCSDAMLPLQEYTKHKPGDPQGLHALGLAYKCVGRVNNALDALKRAERLDPKNAEVHYDLGVMLAHAARTEEAIQELDAAARIEPADPETHRQLGLLLEKTGNNQAARAESAKARALRVREDEQATAGKLNAEANQYLLAGNARAAVSSYRRALELNRTDAKLHYNLSLALDKLGDRMAVRTLCVWSPVPSARTLSSTQALPWRRTSWVCSLCSRGRQRRRSSASGRRCLLILNTPKHRAILEFFAASKERTRKPPRIFSRQYKAILAIPKPTLI